MLSPKFGQEYSRKDIHSIFSPDTPFYPGSGTWGNHGVIPIPDTQKSYVFIASYHSKQGEHVFQEGITRDGILTWQSQPHQSLTEKRVQHWVNHDNDTDDIHFFLRPSKNGPYTYLGRLAYISHDPVKERPVYFQFKLLDWEPSLVSEALYGPEPKKLKPVLRNDRRPAPSNGTNILPNSYLSVGLLCQTVSVRLSVNVYESDCQTEPQSLRSSDYQTTSVTT